MLQTHPSTQILGEALVVETAAVDRVVSRELLFHCGDTSFWSGLCRAGIGPQLIHPSPEACWVALGGAQIPREPHPSPELSFSREFEGDLPPNKCWRLQVV